MNSKKTMLTLGILLALSSGFAVQGADLTIKSADQVNELTKGNDWAKYDDDQKTYKISYRGSSVGNNVTIGTATDSPDVKYNVYGGVSYDTSEKEVSGNTVTLVNGTITSESSETVGTLVGGQNSLSGIDVKNNTVNIQGGKVGEVFGGRMLGGSGTISGNAVNVSGGEITHQIAGGFTLTTSQVTNNTVTVTGGTIAHRVHGAVGINADSNTVTISGGTFGDNIYGAFAYNNTANAVLKGNTVTIDGKATFTTIYGAQGAENATITGNGVTFNADTTVNAVYGGSANSGSVSGNTVTVNQGKKVTLTGTNKALTGGYIAASGTAEGNGVILDGAVVEGNVYGARGGDNVNITIKDNAVTITNGAALAGYTVYGGADNQGTVSGNTVSTTGAVTAKAIYGGFTKTGTVSGNHVTLGKGTVSVTENNGIIGGYANGSGNASNNILTIDGATISKTGMTIYGGRTDGKGEVTNNEVHLKNGADVSNVYVYGGSVGSGGTLSGNKVIVHDAGGWGDTNTVSVKSIGGLTNGVLAFEELSFNDTTFTVKDSDASYNASGWKWTGATNLNRNNETIAINSFDVKGQDLAVSDTGVTKKIQLSGIILKDKKDVTIGVDTLQKDHVDTSDTNGIRVYGFNVTQHEVTDQQNSQGDNTISITANVNKSILAGNYTSADGTYANTTATGTIGDGNLKLGTDGITSTNASIVAGAYSESGDAAGGNVTISGELKAADFFKTTDTNADKTIYAGYSTKGQSTGNTLTLHDATTDISLKAGNTPDKVSNNAVSITGTNSVQNITGFNTYTFNNVNVASKDTMLTIKGNTDISKDTTYHVNLATNQTAKAGDTLHLISGDTVDLTGYSAVLNSTQGVGLDVSGMVVGDKRALTYKVTDVKASAKANDVAASHVTAVGFLTEGTDLVLYGINSVAQEDTYGLQTFAATERSDSSYTNGTDIDGWKVLAGIGGRHKLTSGDLAWGVFAERGLGSYTTNLEHGSGDVEYNGGGAALRYTKDSGLYTEASFRLGTLHDDVDNILGGYDYDTSANYQAFHVGVGKLIPSGNGTWDIYGKYFYTKADDAGFTVDNQYYGLDTVESQRIRLGARYSKPTNERLAWYYGAAWEYEFDGDADGNVAGYALNTASLGGSTVLGEVGLTYKPQADSRWDLELGIKGYTGERDGVSGVLRGAYHF